MLANVDLVNQTLGIMQISMDDRREFENGASDKTSQSTSAVEPPVIFRFPDLRPLQTKNSAPTEVSDSSTIGVPNCKSLDTKMATSFGDTQPPSSDITKDIQDSDAPVNGKKQNLISHVAAGIFAAVLTGFIFFVWRGTRDNNNEIRPQPPTAWLKSNAGDNWEVTGPAQPLLETKSVETVEGPSDAYWHDKIKQTGRKTNGPPPLTSSKIPTATVKLGNPEIVDDDRQEKNVFGSSTNWSPDSGLENKNRENNSVVIRTFDVKTSPSPTDVPPLLDQSVQKQSTGFHKSTFTGNLDQFSRGLNTQTHFRQIKPPAISDQQHPQKNNAGTVSSKYSRTDPPQTTSNPNVTHREVAHPNHRLPYPITTKESSYLQQRIADPRLPIRTSQRVEEQTLPRNLVDGQRPLPSAQLQGRIENPPIERSHELHGPRLY